MENKESIDDKLNAEETPKVSKLAQYRVGVPIMLATTAGTLIDPSYGAIAGTAVVLIIGGIANIYINGDTNEKLSK